MGVCDVPGVSHVCDSAGEAAATLVSAPFEWLAAAMGEAAGWMFEAVWKAFDATTLVDVTRREYLGVYNIVFGIAVFIMLLFFCLQLITGLVKRDPTALSRAALGLAKSVLGSFVVITLTALALEIVDQLCVGIVHATGQTTETMGDKIALLVAGLTSITIAAPGVGAIITIFFAGLAISAAMIVWLSLLVRKALLLVAIVLAPIAFAGASWDATRGWIGKWAAFVIALIVSKLVLVVVFLVATTQVAAPIDSDLASVSEPIAGIVLMFIAAFAPYMTYRFVSFVGFDLYQSMGAEQEAKGALNRPIPIPGRIGAGGGEPKKVLDADPSTPSSSGGGTTPKAGQPQGTSTSAGSSAAGEGAAGASGAEAGAGGSAGAGGGAGAATAAGPAAAGVVAAKEAATAGPKVGDALGSQAEAAADGAEQSTTNPASPPPPPSTPVPKSLTPPPPSALRPEQEG